MSSLAFHHATEPSRGVAVEHFGPASRRSRLLATALRVFVRPVFGILARIAHPGLLRVAKLSDLAGAVLPRPFGARLSKWACDGFGAEWVTAKGVAHDRPSDAAVLYFHGGAFIACGLRTHRPLAIRISAASRLPVLNVAYRQLPACGLKGSVDDALAAYVDLLASGVPAARIVVAGDSAGAHVAVSMMLAARARGLHLPAAAVLLSPFVEIDMARKRASANAALDPFLPESGVARIIEFVRAGDGLDGIDSLVEADLTGLPPTLIQVGSTEILRADAETLADNLARHGVPSTLQVWDRQVHVFQAMGGDFVPEAKAAIAEIGAFIRTNTPHLSPVA